MFYAEERREVGCLNPFHTAILFLFSLSHENGDSVGNSLSEIMMMHLGTFVTEKQVSFGHICMHVCVSNVLYVYVPCIRFPRFCTLLSMCVVDHPKSSS